MGNLLSHKTTFIYSLTDPRNNEVFYVGQSFNPKRRLTEHIYHSKTLEYWRNTHNAKEMRIQAILEANAKPILEILEETTGLYADEREDHWAAFYRNQGHVLTNVGVIHANKEWRDKFREVKKERDALLVEIAEYLGVEQRYHLVLGTLREKNGKKLPYPRPESD